MNYFQNNRGFLRDFLFFAILIIFLLYIYAHYQPIEKNMAEKGITQRLDSGVSLFKANIWDVFLENMRKVFHGLPTTVEEKFMQDNPLK